MFRSVQRVSYAWPPRSGSAGAKACAWIAILGSKNRARHGASPVRRPARRRRASFTLYDSSRFCGCARGFCARAPTTRRASTIIAPRSRSNRTRSRRRANLAGAAIAKYAAPRRPRPSSRGAVRELQHDTHARLVRLHRFTPSRQRGRPPLIALYWLWKRLWKSKRRSFFQPPSVPVRPDVHAEVHVQVGQGRAAAQLDAAQR